MGERPGFNHSGTVTVTHQRHHEQAKHASPTLRHWYGLERRWEAAGEAALHLKARFDEKALQWWLFCHPQLYPVPWLL